MKQDISDIMKDVEALIDLHRNPDLKHGLLTRIYSAIEAQRGLPKEPPACLIDSMCMRYSHDFWLDKNPDAPLSSGWTPEEREGLRRHMRQVYEEVSGHGFYKWK